MNPPNIGFTGTRHPLTPMQRAALEKLLIPEYGRERPELHHGACKGADSIAACRAWELNYDVIAHPGESAHGGDNEWLCPVALEHSCQVLPTKTHFARNRDIVDATEILFACPNHCEPITKDSKGGTAYTVNYARKKGKRIWIILPDGTVEIEHP